MNVVSLIFFFWGRDKAHEVINVRGSSWVEAIELGQSSVTIWKKGYALYYNIYHLDRYHKKCTFSFVYTQTNLTGTARVQLMLDSERL